MIYKNVYQISVNYFMTSAEELEEYIRGKQYLLIIAEV